MYSIVAKKNGMFGGITIEQAAIAAALGISVVTLTKVLLDSRNGKNNGNNNNNNGNGHAGNNHIPSRFGNGNGGYAPPEMMYGGPPQGQGPPPSRYLIPPGARPFVPDGRTNVAPRINLPAGTQMGYEDEEVGEIQPRVSNGPPPMFPHGMPPPPRNYPPPGMYGYGMGPPPPPGQQTTFPVRPPGGNRVMMR